jgi:GT2 family glycosyltransferase
LNATVVIVTLERPECVRRCLEALASQGQQPEQVIVVDASRDGRTQAVVDTFPDVVYLQNTRGVGSMTDSRNIALASALGDVVAFLDDDAFPHPNWLEALLAAYDAPDVGAAGGRVLGGRLADQEADPLPAIGTILPNGEIAAGFDADPRSVVDVEHVMGCNMSFRREVLARLGGFRDDFGLRGLREETDACLRVRRLGYRIRFAPAAAVDHLGAPQAAGARNDVRYTYAAKRNHVILLVRNFGPRSPLVRRYLLHAFANVGIDALRRLAGAFVRPAAAAAGLAVGLVRGLAFVCRHGLDPVRDEPSVQKLPPRARQRIRS